MDLPVKKMTLQNAVVAGDVTTGNGYIYIKGLPPIRTEDYISVTYVDPTAEVVQIKGIGVTAVTIAISTLYQIGIGNTRDQREGWNNNIQKFGYYSPASLAATPALDRFNAYSALSWKVNNTPTIRAICGVRCDMVLVASPLITIVANVPTFVVGSLSGAIGFLAVQADSTAVIIRPYIVNGILPVVNDVWSLTPNPWTGVTSGTWSAGSATTAAAAPTVGVQMAVVDNANYYSAKGTRQGANTVIATAGFLPSAVTTITAPVYSQGQAARMAQDIPVQEVTSGNLASGDWDFPTNDTPTAGSTYETIVVRCRPHLDNSAMSDLGTQAEIMYGIYAEKTNTASAGVTLAGYTAYKAVLDAL